MQIFNWHGYIRFLGLPHLRDNPDVPIWTLFVEFLLTEQHVPPDRPIPQWPPYTTVLDAVQKHARLVVLGDPGSGKSTLVSWLAWQFSRPMEGLWTARIGPLVPLPMVLRELRIGRGLTWEHLLDAFLAHPVARPFDGKHAPIDEILARGQGFILIDGLDEIGSVDVRRGLRDAVFQGGDRYPSCHWLLTSRIVGYEQVPFDRLRSDIRDDSSFEGCLNEDTPPSPHPDRLRFTQAGAVSVQKAAVRYVAPCRDEQIAQLCRNWFAQREQVPAEAERKAGLLVQAIRRNAGTQRLARIPNLLTMMALIYRVRSQLPHGRTLLYHQIAEAYLESIDEFRNLREVDYTLNQKKGWLALLGFQMQRRRTEDEQQEDEAPREILVEKPIVEGWLLVAMRATQPEATAEQAARFLDYIGRRSGLLLPRGEAQYAFTHLSFQEYFAACYLADRIIAARWLEGRAPDGAGPDDLARYVSQSAWRETLDLLFEILAERADWSDVLFDRLFEAGCPRVAALPPRDQQKAALLLAEPRSIRTPACHPTGASPPGTPAGKRKWPDKRRSRTGPGNGFPPSPRPC